MRELAKKSKIGETYKLKVNPSLFDRIEEITFLIEQDFLDDTELEKLSYLLSEIAEETDRVDGRIVSFFQDETISKLKKLLPGDLFFKYIEENPDFIDTVDLLVGGKESYERILHNIDKARESIHITMFVWRDDSIGNKIAKALLSAANRGVKITIQKDALASIFEYTEQNRQTLFHKDTNQLMIRRKAIDSAYGDEEKRGQYAQRPNLYMSELIKHANVFIEREIRKDHSKYFIFDEETIITGGVNIGDEYDRGDFHDYMIEMKSPLLAKRLKSRVEMTEDLDEGLSIGFIINARRGEKKEFEIKAKVLELLSVAKKQITIEMAYFGDEEVSEAIIKAAKRGVKVDIILPRNANIQDSLNKQVIEKLINETHSTGNLTVYLYPNMVHAKVINVDGKYTFMGSANLNKGAMEKLGETNVLVTDADCEFTLEVLKSLRKDIERSEMVKTPPRITYNRLRAEIEKNLS